MKSSAPVARGSPQSRRQTAFAHKPSRLRTAVPGSGSDGANNGQPTLPEKSRPDPRAAIGHDRPPLRGRRYPAVCSLPAAQTSRSSPVHSIQNTDSSSIVDHRMSAMLRRITWSPPARRARRLNIARCFRRVRGAQVMPQTQAEPPSLERRVPRDDI